MIGLFYLLYAFIKLGINYPLMRIIQNKGAHFGLGAGFTFSIFEISVFWAILTLIAWYFLF